MELPAPLPRQEPTFREKFASWKGRRAQYQDPAAVGKFEQVCSTLFQIQIRRRPGPRRAPIMPGDFEAIYAQWEDQAVRKVATLPLHMSQAVYNFTRTQEYSKSGRLGLPIPMGETRAKYRSLVGGFLLFCRQAQPQQPQPPQNWANELDLSDCWMNFVKTPNAMEEQSRIVLIGSYIENQLEGKQKKKRIPHCCSWYSS